MSTDTPLSTETVPAEECWSLDEAEFRYSSLCDLIDCNDGELHVGQTVYVADQVPADYESFFDADDLVDRLAEVAYDNHGEYAEGWPPTIKQEAKDEFNAFVAAWIEKHCPPSFYGVENVRPYTLTEEDLRDE
jgi:hypothetical protein